MVALTALALAAGIGSMAYGAYENSQGQAVAQQGYALQQQGAAQQAQAARDQAQVSKDQATASVSYAGQQQALNIQESQESLAAAAASHDLANKQIADQQAINTQNQTAMELDARRQQMQDVRTAQQARAMSLATGVAQGGSGFVGGSSARGGAYGEISGQSNVNLLGVSQNLQIGETIFGLNTDISNQKIAQNNLEYSYAQQQAADQTTSANLTYNYAVTQAGFTDRLADIQTENAQGVGLQSQGSGLVSQGQMQASAGNSFLSAGPSIFSAGTNANQLFGSTFQTSIQTANNFWFGGGSPSGYGA
jgi:hypothetical protein